MNKQIKQICQEISCEDILNKKFYPVWLFTNERIGYFFPELESQKGIKKVFSIGGGGDFALSLLSTSKLNELDEINICDKAQMANISIDLKLAIFKKFKYKEMLNSFLNRNTLNKELVYSIIKKEITPLSRKILDFILVNRKEGNFLKCLNKSGLWYKESFRAVKNKAEYLPYLVSEERYQLMQNNLGKITIYCGDFNDNLRLFKDSYYDLIYASNVLDSKEYCQNPNLYLQTIKEKLSRDGLLFVITQDSNKIIELIERQRFFIYEKQLHKFDMISSLLGHYSYSFLLFKKNEF